MSLRGKLASAFAVAALIGLIGSLALALLFQSQSLFLDADRARERLDALEQVRTTLLDAETGQRGFLLTQGRESYLSPYKMAAANWRSTLLNLETRFQGEPSQLEQITRLKALASQKMGELAETMAIATTGAGYGAALAEVLTDRGKSTMAEIRQILDQLEARETATLAAGLAHYRRIALLGRLIIGFGTATALFLMLLTNWGIASEFSERERLRLELQSHAEVLAKSQASVAVQLAKANRLNQELERINRDLDQFAYVASHDLKAPLRGIANLSTWIEEELAASMTATAKEQMELLRGRVHRLEALIDGILGYSRAGRVLEATRPVDVARLITEIVELSPPPPGTRLETGDLPTLVTEKVELQQVFMNLLSNAFKHGRKEDAVVRVTGEQASGAWSFCVADNGEGIDPKYHDRVFGIFQTLNSRDKVEGTGIGLAVVRKLVERRGGNVRIESQVGHGARFIFSWPELPRG